MWRLLALPAVPIVVIVAQATPGGDIPTWVIGVLSGVGAFLATLMSGKVVVPTFAYTRERERADKWEAEAMRLNGVIAERMIPALVSSVQANTESTGAIKQALVAFGRRRA